ncbi:hypothetical protein [Geomonas agri]|uniref:hypothetical protein n=1 Tax=Geomonas agri TaxID=2873702 RepID=UPI001CD31A0B|nr:hypothetical protein [Geomonas agri]
MAEGKIEKANDLPDETEWLLPEWLHIYYCPFCGSFIKGEGFGTYHEEAKKARIQQGQMHLTEKPSGDLPAR